MENITLVKFMGQVAATVAMYYTLRYLAKLLWREFKQEYEKFNPNPKKQAVRQEVTLAQLFNGLFHLYSVEHANSIEIVRNTDNGISNAVWEITLGRREGMASADIIAISDDHATIEEAYNELVMKAGGR